MVALADTVALNVSLDELDGNRLAQKMLVTRLISLEGEVTELRESNAVLSSQVANLRQSLARRDGELRIVRAEREGEKQASRVREVIGGIGLASLSAGLGLIASNGTVGVLLAGLGAFFTLCAYLVSRSVKGATSTVNRGTES